MSSAIKPIKNDHPGEWHQERFIEFARAKSAIGEPTPHMRVVDYLSRDCDTAERVWRVGAYLAAYSVITGEAIWENWSYPKASSDPTGLHHWVGANWPGFHTRKPRRCVRTPEKFNRCLAGYLSWQQTEFPRLCALSSASSPELSLTPMAEYDAWWDSANDIPFFGRYIAIRLLEVMRRYGHMSAHLYDIRAVGAHSPIRCLMLLRPDKVEPLMTGDAKTVDVIGSEVKAMIEATGLELSWFTYATLLCEYRAGYEDGGDYAGNQHDEELEYSLGRYAKYWEAQGLRSRLYEARAAIDPHTCLGELQGWSRRRLDVAGWLRSRGVVWSDISHDYLMSVSAGQPVLRSN